eukprot:jgi/Phyca11/82100/gw1.14.811.1
MLKTAIMMVALLQTAKAEPNIEAADSRAILLLDFRKAYDTVAREFMLLALRKFNFAKEFIAMVEKLHQGTTAKFLVNTELSQQISVETGIRQGCPLAPLLFILSVEVLAVAINDATELQGIAIP